MSYLFAALSCEQRPFFLVTRLFSEILLPFVIVKSDRLNKSKVESGKTRLGPGEGEGVLYNNSYGQGRGQHLTSCRPG